MRYSLLAGGKRIRPVLALATAEALSIDADTVMPLAAALEMIHTYSLIHAALCEIADAAGVGGMVGGQYLDVAGNERDDAAGLRRVHELKTGRLIAASVGCVLDLSGMAQPATILYRRFAAELGVLFQIVDDILDVTGDEQALGKPQGSDERHGKRTYVSVFGLERARELAADSHRKARAALTDTGGRTAKLEQISDYILTRQT
jgi:geranylgeranyl diphosphate synthase type II